MRTRLSTQRGVMLQGSFAVALVFALVALIGMPVRAQVSTGTVGGTVKDSSGAVIVGANITVKNVATGITRNTVSDDRGSYIVPDLLIGSYEVQAQKEGFQTSVEQDVNVVVGQQAVVDFSLKVGRVAQTVTVESNAAQIDTTSADFGTLVNQNQIQSLPLNGRDYEQLILLAPGVDKNVTQGTNATVGRDQSFSVAGQRPQGQYVILDGTLIQNFWNRGGGNTLVGTSLGIDAIAEFTVLTNSYGAEYGGTGSVVNQVTKSGTNTLHGDAYDYLRNSTFDARNYFDPLSGPPAFRRNQFGGSLGGPIKKNKAFFFVNYEGLRQLLELDPIFTVPTDQVRGTDPSDPSGEGCIPGATVQCYPLSAAQTAALAAYPEPTPGLTNFGNGTAQARTFGGEIVHENYVNARVDYNLSPSDSIFVRVVNDPATQYDPFGPTANFTVPEQGTGIERYATVSYKKIISPNLINLVQFGFVRTILQTTYNFNPDYVFAYFPGRPANGDLSIAGLSEAGIDGNDPIAFRQNKFSESDDLIWTHGSHEVRTGITISRLETNDNSQLGLGGVYSYNNLTAFLLNEQCAVATASTCTIGPTSFTGGLPGEYDSERGYREIDLSPYYQDDWKVRSNLTLNLGVRYDYGTNPVEDRNKLHEIINPLTSTGYSPVPHVFSSNPNWRNIQPRIGFAYSPGHSIAIRGGFDMFDDVVSPRLYAEGYNSNPPYVYGTQPAPAPFPAGFLGSVALPLPSQPQAASYTNPYASYVYEYNLNIQKQLSRNSDLTVGYLGSNGRRWETMVDLNPPVVTTAPDGNPYIANGNNLVNPNLGVENFFVPEFDNNYNSLQVAYNDFFRHEIQSQISYTYSKCLDFGSNELGSENNGTTTSAQVNPYPGGHQAEYGRCNYDVRHNLTANTAIALPFHQNRWVGGWQLNGILTGRTGQAFSVATGFHQSRITSNATERPDWAPGLTNRNPITGNPHQWFDPAAFTLEPPGEFGDEDRNSLSTAGIFELDTAIVKNTKLTERLDTQFRVEFFNITNHTNFGAPNVNAFLASSNPSAPGYVNGGVPNPSAGIITTTTTTSRQIQFALKLIF